MRRQRSTAVLRSHSTWTMTHRHCRAKKPINFQILPHPYRSHPEIRKSRHLFLLKMIAKRNRLPPQQQQHNRRHQLFCQVLRRRRHPVQRQLRQQQQRRQQLWLVIVIVMYKVMPRSHHHQRRFLLQCYHQRRQSNRLKLRPTSAEAAVVKLRRRAAPSRRGQLRLHRRRRLHPAVEMRRQVRWEWPPPPHRQLFLQRHRKRHRLRPARALIALNTRFQSSSRRRQHRR